MSRIRLIFLTCALTCALFSFSTPSAYALSGTCRSAAEFGQVKDALKNSLGSGQYGVLTWCVCARDRGMIIYRTSVTRNPTFARPVIRDYFSSAAEQYGGCYASPKQELIVR